MEDNKFIIPLLAILAPIIYSNIGHILGIWESPWLLVVLIIIYVSIGSFIMHTYKTKLWSKFFIVVLLIPIGVILDVLIDWNLRSIDRNLFPFEMLFLLVVAPILLLLGMGLTKLVSSNKANSHG